jgi:hypothetical protein
MAEDRDAALINLLFGMARSDDHFKTLTAHGKCVVLFVINQVTGDPLGDAFLDAARQLVTEDITFVCVNCQTTGESARRLGVTRIPSVLLLHGGHEIGRTTEAENFEAFVRRVFRVRGEIATL